MTKLEAVARQLVDKAIAVDARMIRPALAEARKNELRAEGVPAAPEIPRATDREVADGARARLVRGREPATRHSRQMPQSFRICASRSRDPSEP